MSTVEKFERYLREGGLSDRTITTYIGYLRTAIRASGASNLAGYLDMNITATTRNSAYTALRHWAVFADDQELLGKLDDPALKRRLKGRGKKASKVTRPMTGEQLDAFLAALEKTRGKSPKWVWPCVTVLLRLGLRAQVDLCRLNRLELMEGYRSGRLQLETKGGKMRTVPTGPAKEAIKSLLDARRWNTIAELIVGEDDEQRAYREIYKAVRGIAKAAGIDYREVHPHRLRHTAAHKLWERTKDILKVRDFLGHSNVATTERYLRGDRTDEIGADLEGMYDD